MEESKCYRVSDIQKMLMISRPTVYKLFKKNEFPVKKFGNKYRIPKSTFDAWLVKQENFTF